MDCGDVYIVWQINTGADNRPGMKSQQDTVRGLASAALPLLSLCSLPSQEDLIRSIQKRLGTSNTQHSGWLEPSQGSGKDLLSFKQEAGYGKVVQSGSIFNQKRWRCGGYGHENQGRL